MEENETKDRERMPERQKKGEKTKKRNKEKRKSKQKTLPAKQMELGIKQKETQAV